MKNKHKYYAVYSIILDEVYYSDNKEVVELFIHDRMRNPRDFLVKEIKEIPMTEMELTDAFYANTSSDRILTPVEIEMLNTELESLWNIKNHCINLINELKFISDENDDKIKETLCRYMKFVNSSYELLDEGELDETEDYDDKLNIIFNYNAVIDNIILDNSGTVDKETFNKILEERRTKTVTEFIPVSNH